MSRKNLNEKAPFQTINSTAKITGLSTYFLRAGCKDGTIPHIKVGNTVYVNIPALMALGSEG